MLLNKWSLWTRGISFLINETQFFFQKLIFWKLVQNFKTFSKVLKNYYLWTRRPAQNWILKLKKYQVFEHSLFLGLNVWDLDESCAFKKINHSKNRFRIMESLHEWSKQFKCDTLYCCYLHILTT
ncbi:unnamed protein product [Rhizophagus irregularis]|nr:unnamed protein product [Rhizophagus irregularis]